jgi:hypothetical protein
MYFSLWGYVKELNFCMKVANINDLCVLITEADASATPQMLESSWCKRECCLDILWADIV